jgi:hypothetical protein
MKKTLTWWMTLAVLVLTRAGSVNAEIIYDNLSATTYDANDGWTVSTKASGEGEFLFHTESFVAATTGHLSDVLIAMWSISGANTFNLTLTDSSSTTLESWSGIAAPHLGNGIEVVTVPSVLDPLLTSGSTYTLSAVATADTWDAWEFSPNASLHPSAGGFRVEGEGGTATPEPGSLTLLGLGLASFGAIAWMNKRKTKVVTA